MVETTINYFDLFIVLVIAISALISFFRGFIRELLSLGAWVGACVITLYSFPTVTQHLKPHFSSEMVASGLAAMGTFMVLLVAISLFNGLLMRLLRQGKDIGLLDNLLGMGFGVIRASLLVSLGYFIVTLVMTERDFPEFMAESRTLPFVKKGALTLSKIAPNYLETLSPLTQKGISEYVPDGEDIEGVFKSDKDTDGDRPQWMDSQELEKMIENADEEQ